jgi:drug/metabolite transporter (DMT)-like permease
MIFGVADFMGGVASRRSPAVSVVVTSQIVGGAGILFAAVMVSERMASPAEFGWGAAAGMAGGVGIVLLYHALATTRMSVTAPVTALFGTATPVLFGIVTGERPAPIAWVGVVVGLVAVIAISRAPDVHNPDLKGGPWSVFFGAAAGITFGLFGILISRTGTESGLWPLVGARVSSLVLLVIVALIMRRPIIAPDARGLSAGAGLLDMVANVLYLVAVRQELLSLITVIMSMYPVATIGLARSVLGEEIQRTQFAGLALGAVAIGLIVLG